MAQFPERLTAFCGVDPLRYYALEEIDRCSRNPLLKSGLKLHFGNSDVDLDNLAHIAKLQRVFRSADRHGMAIAVHLHANVDHHKPYGAKQAGEFLNSVLPFASHVVIQIAHLVGSGGYDDPTDDEALSVFVEALATHDSKVRSLYFDISGVAGFGDWEAKKGLIASRIHQIGPERILYGTDGSWTDFTTVKGIAAYRRLPLSPAEFLIIDANIPPYLKH